MIIWGDHLLFPSFSVITEWFPRMDPTFKEQHTEAGEGHCCPDENIVYFITILNPIKNPDTESGHWKT